MTDHTLESVIDLRRLGPRPREVSLGLRFQLLANRGVLRGLFYSGLLLVPGWVFIQATDLLGALRLGWARREAPGRLERVEKLGRADGDDSRLIHRYRYSFRLPDGATLEGASYSRGRRFTEPEVTVEYAPGNPATNRLRGTRTGRFGLEILLFPLFLLSLGMVSILAGIRNGLRRIDLLVRGQATEATILACRVSENRWSRELPFRRLFAHGAARLMVFGIAFYLSILVTIFAGKDAIPFKGRPGFFFFSFFIAWFGLTILLSRWLDSAFGGRELECLFALGPVEGELVQVRDKVARRSRLGEGPREPALHDPERPRRALLLNGLYPPLAVSPFGEWEASAAPRSVLRLSLALVCFAAGPLLGWAFWRGVVLSP